MVLDTPASLEPPSGSQIAAAAEDARGLEPVADGVCRIALPPRGAVNAYVAGDVLVDSGYGAFAGRLLHALAGRRLSALALTHAHGDHAGAARRVHDELGIPVWAPAGDAEALRRGRVVIKPAPLGPLRGLLARANGWPAVEPDRLLREGDEVAGFAVLEAPGHSPGHVAFWRAADRVLIAGDVWFNLNLLTLRPDLRQPPWAFTVDPERNRRSIRRLAELEPEIACFGHGPVITGAAPRLKAFVDAL